VPEDAVLDDLRIELRPFEQRAHHRLGERLDVDVA
jgi:hypothetical protein